MDHLGLIVAALNTALLAAAGKYLQNMREDLLREIEHLNQRMMRIEGVCLERRARQRENC